MTRACVVRSALIQFCLSFGMFSLPVSKTNLSVHEDKNRVPYVKVSVSLMYFHLALL